MLSNEIDHIIIKLDTNVAVEVLIFITVTRFNYHFAQVFEI